MLPLLVFIARLGPADPGKEGVNAAMAHLCTECQRTTRLVSRRPTSNSENASSRPCANSPHLNELHFYNSEPIPSRPFSVQLPASSLQGYTSHLVDGYLSRCLASSPPINHHSPVTTRQPLPGVPAAPLRRGALPETANRVELGLTHRKQSTGYPSTRDSSHPTNFHQSIASAMAAECRLAFHESRITSHESKALRCYNRTSGKTWRRADMSTGRVWA